MKKRSSDAVEYLKEEFELEDKIWKDEMEFKKNESNAQAAIRVNEDSKSTESAINGFIWKKGFIHKVPTREISSRFCKFILKHITY